MLVLLGTIIFIIFSPALAVLFFVLYIFGKRHVILIKWAIALLVAAKVHRFIKIKALESEEFNILFAKFNKAIISKGFFAKSQTVDEIDEEESSVHIIKLGNLELDKNPLNTKQFYIVEKHSKYLLTFIYPLSYPLDKKTKMFSHLEDLFDYAKGEKLLEII